MRLIRPYDDPARDEWSLDEDGANNHPAGPAIDRFLTPAEQRRLVDRDRSSWWILAIAAAVVGAFLVAWAAVVVDLARSWFAS